MDISWIRIRMNMKKRIFTLCMMVIVGLLTACGSKKQNDTQADSETTQEIVTTQATTVTETEAVTTQVTTEATTEDIKKGIKIAIDPGHQSPSVDMSAMEPVAPGSSEQKMKATGGTQGRYTGVPEYRLNLDISLKLREALQEEGYDVVLTRENNETAISNAERATLANESGADVLIRIHANGSDDSSTNGALALVGSPDNPYVGNLYDDSYRLADCVLEHYCEETQMKNLGIQNNDTMTGINWSKIPVIILEMGFMTNEQDDYHMQDAEYQASMVRGIVNGINAYYGVSNEEKSTSGYLDDLEGQLRSDVQASGLKEENVSIYTYNLASGTYAQMNSKPMQSASLIKLYVAGCAYENMDVLESQESYSGETGDLMKKMITQSDNDATNTLVTRLGSGTAENGMQKVNEYCKKYDFTDTSMGRLMLDFSSSKDNYTSVKDCTLFLQKIYQSELAGSQDILGYLKQQERTSKIPAGVPHGVATANKTGELEDVENDAAIIYGDGATYILCVMTDNLQDASVGRSTIVQLSKTAYSYFNN